MQHATVVLAFAISGAFAAGEDAAKRDVQIGSRFLGAAPAADQQGLTRNNAEQDLDIRALRSVFIAGYIGWLGRDPIIKTDINNIVLEFTRGQSVQ